MIGRDEQRRGLDDLVTGARSGRGGAVLVFGEPGIGKSALLADAVARAEGVRVLSVTGLASEAELPYATLALLLAPILAVALHLDETAKRRFGLRLRQPVG
jgi:hypothetical protein